MSIAKVVGGLFNSQRTLSLHFLLVYMEWSDGHQGHTIP